MALASHLLLGVLLQATNAEVRRPGPWVPGNKAMVWQGQITTTKQWSGFARQVSWYIPTVIDDAPSCWLLGACFISKIAQCASSEIIHGFAATVYPEIWAFHENLTRWENVEEYGRDWCIRGCHV